MKIVVFGATSQISQECIKIWARDGADFLLVGRSLDTLNEISADLQVRYPKLDVDTQELDFNDVKKVEKIFSSAGEIDLCLVAQGSLTDQNRAVTDIQYLREELILNAVTAATVAQAALTKMEFQGKGTLGIIGSVAGDRGRAYNYAYGASKALLETYVEGMQQRIAGSSIQVCLIKPGPTATPMTANHKGKMAEAKIVATVIVDQLKQGKRVIYAPAIWKYIMLVVRRIPFFIFKKLKF